MSNAGKTNLLDWPAEYCPCVDPMRQLIDVKGQKHLPCNRPVAPWEIEKRKFDRSEPRKSQ